MKLRWQRAGLCGRSSTSPEVCHTARCSCPVSEPWFSPDLPTHAQPERKHAHSVLTHHRLSVSLAEERVCADLN